MLVVSSIEANSIIKKFIYDNFNEIINNLSKKFEIDKVELYKILDNLTEINIKDEFERPQLYKNNIKKVLDNESKNLNIDSNKCMARISKKGIYSQCTRNKRDTFDYCGFHISRRPYQRIDEPLEIDDDENICLNCIDSSFKNIDIIDAKEIKSVVDSIPNDLGLELDYESVDDLSDFENINIDESKIYSNNSDSDEEINIECKIHNINGVDYYWNKKTNDLYDMDEKYVGKVIANGKIQTIE